MKDRKFKMRIPQLLLAILLVLAIIALICYGYYKQTQVIDKYEEYYGDTNTVENETVEDSSAVFVTKDLISVLFPLGHIETDSSVLSYHLTDFIENEQTKSTFFVIGIKELMLNDVDVSTIKQTNTIIQNVTNQVAVESVAEKSEYATKFVALNPKAELKDDKLLLTFNTVYFRDLGEYKKEDGTKDNVYICYQRYNYQTDTYVGRLSDTIYSGDLINTVQDSDVSQLEKQTLQYKYDAENNKYSFEKIIVE